MSIRFFVAIFLAVVAIACTHTDPSSSDRPTIRLAASEPKPCAQSVTQGPSDACSAKTMAGQRPSSYR
jgi:hypothetical protein